MEQIAQRVAALMASRAPAPGEKAASASPAPPTPEQHAAAERANRILDDAIVRGRLRREDVLEMRRHLAEAGSPQEAQELTRRIAQAINQNKLVPEDPRFIMP